MSEENDVTPPLGAGSTLEEALERIESPNPRDRSVAATRLGQLREGLEALQRAATDRNGYVRAAAAEALGGFEAAEVALYLGDLLYDRNPYVRSAAVRSLGRVGAREYSDAISEFTLDDNPYIRGAALRALSDLGASESASLLVQALDDSHRRIRLDAARGLRRLGDPATAGAIGDQILAGLEAARLDLPLLNTLIQALAACNVPQKSGSLLVHLLQEAIGCRTMAARALRDAPYEPARTPLERALTDTNPNLRLAALRALEALGLGPSLPHVRTLLREERDARLLRAASDAVADAGDHESLPILQELIYSQNPLLRPAAVEGVARLEPDGSLPLLLSLLGDNNVAVRSVAVEHLATRLDRPDVRAALEDTLDREVSSRLIERIEELLDG